MERATLRITDEKQKRAMPRRFAFTEAKLRSMKAPTDRRVVWVYDSLVGALAFSVTDKGAKSFYFYRKFQGRPVRKQLASLDKMSVKQARERVTQLNAKYNAGVDAVADERRIGRSVTVGDLWTAYKRDHLDVRATKKTIASDSSLYHIALEIWKDRPIQTLTVEACRDRHRELGKENGGRTANRGMHLIRRLCAWARLPALFERREIDWFPEQSRERFLEAGEIKRLMTALESADVDIRDALKLAMLTGARRENIASMAWSEIDLEARIWRIPAEKSKNRNGMIVPLAPDALIILAARQTNAGESPHVFPHPSDPTRHLPGYDIWKQFVEIRTAAKLTDVRVHDLRRTLGSWMTAQGANLQTIGKALGHQNQASTAIYARMNLSNVRTAVDAAAAAMMAAGKSSTKGGKSKNPKK